MVSPAMSTARTNPVSDALNLGILEQSVLLPLAGMILDGGGILLVAFFALAAYWGAVLLIRLRRRGFYTKLDLAFFRWGFFIVCVTSFFLARWIWRLRGYVA
jgi:hypothetical protein